MKSFTCLLVSLVVVGWSVVAQAAENPTGTWKWTATFNNQTRELSVKLKLDGEKLTGSIPGRNNQETAIEDGAFKNDEVSFKVTRERNGQKFTQSFKGKVSGDTITGTIETQRDGQSQSRAWEAKRAP